MDTIKNILEKEFDDRVYVVEENSVWVSGMNANCRYVAEKMAQLISSHDIPTSLPRDDEADMFGGVEFRYGQNA